MSTELVKRDSNPAARTGRASIDATVAVGMAARGLLATSQGMQNDDPDAIIERETTNKEKDRKSSKFTSIDEAARAQPSSSAPKRASIKVSDIRPKGFLPVGRKIPDLPCIRDTSGLTTEWLTKVFRYRNLLEPNGTIDEIKARTIGEGQGEYGDLSLLTIVKATGAKDGLPKNMIAKMCPQQANLSAYMLKNIYLNEAHFYNDFTVDSGGLPRPECYHVAADVSSSPPKFCFLIENAVIGAQGEGGESLQYQRSEGIDNEAHMNMVMDGLAKFHATWWGTKKKPPLQWAIHPLTSFWGLGRNVIPVLTKQGLNLLPKLMTDMTYPDGTPVPKFGADYAPLLKWKPQLMGRLRYLTRQLLRPPLTLCHCDTHLENIFFHDRYPGGAAFIDFGNMTFKHGLSDVAFFLATCLEPEVRRKYEKPLVRRYWERLVAHGVQDYSFDLCWHDYKLQLWLAFIQAMTAAPAYLKQRNSQTGMFAPPDKITKGALTQREMYESYNRRCAAALIDHDWIQAIADTETACCSYFGCC